MTDISAYSRPQLATKPSSSSLEILSDYSIYTQELLGKTPAWILRWGTTIILAIILAIILLSWLVKYPDIVSAKVTITTPIPPASLIARQSGKLHWLIKAESTNVNKNDIIALVDNPASHNNIIQLQQWLQRFKVERGEPSYLQSLPQNLRLGDCQTAFAQLQKLINEWLFYLESDPLAKKIRINEQKQVQLKIMLGKLQNQNLLLRNENVLLDKNMSRFQELLKQNLVSANSLEEKQLTVLNNQRQQEQIGLEASRIQLELTNLSAELNELTLTDNNKREAFKLNFEEAYQALQTSLNQWEKSYLLTAPIRGRLVLSKFWGEYQAVNSGEEVMTIVPFETQTILAKMKMPPENSGKVKKGQKILIKLAGYPFQEYGHVVSKINSISLIPRENQYTVDAILPSPLITSYKKTLDFHQEMQGQAEIITEDIRLLERVFYQIRKVLKKSE
jgi:HlyD family secretion protein